MAGFSIDRSTDDPRGAFPSVRIRRLQFDVIHVTHEIEKANGWEFQVETVDRLGKPRTFRVMLAWADYNHWSPDGAARPESVAKAVLRFMLQNEPAAEIAESFDAARIRRRYSSADQVIPTLIES